MQCMRILIIEDNPDMAENLAEYFESQCHLVDFAMDGIGGLHLALTEHYDVIILDVILPGMDGLTVCKNIRMDEGEQIPVLMLSARDDLVDKLEGFDAGADDYLVKPFEMSELSARIKALVRRSNKECQLPLKIGTLELDLGKLEVQRSGRLIELNRTCLKLLTILMKASPNVVSRQDLEHELWQDTPPGSDALRSHIYALRQSLDKPYTHPMIHTVHGIGYKLVDPDELSS